MAATRIHIPTGLYRVFQKGFYNFENSYKFYSMRYIAGVGVILKEYTSSLDSLADIRFYTKLKTLIRLPVGTSVWVC